jgi:hypothetical protein
MKYFVYRQNSTGLFWSVNHEWTKYDWATIYSEKDVEEFKKYGFPEDGCHWVASPSPKPTSVIMGGPDVECTIAGWYWAKHKSPDIDSALVVNKKAGSKFSPFFMYVYIPEPNWPV